MADLPAALPRAIAELRALAADIDVAITAIAENAAHTRSCIQSAARLADGSDEHAVAAQIMAVDDAVARKTARLEAERVAVDVALEAALVASETEDGDALLHFTESFQSIPKVPMEPATIYLSPTAEVVAPAALWAWDLAVAGFPEMVRRGSHHLFHIRPKPGHAVLSHGPLGQAAASATLCRLLRVSVCLDADADSGLAQGQRTVELTTTLVPASEVCGVSVSVDVPFTTPVRSAILVAHISVAGLAVPWPGVLGGTEERQALVCVVETPLRLVGAASVGYHTPAITSDGTIYAPMEGTDAVAVFGFDGKPLPAVPLRPLGLYPNRVKVAAVCEESGAGGGSLLLLADTLAGANSTVVAVTRRAAAGTPIGAEDVRWTARGFESTVGVALLPTHGVAIIGSRYENALHVLSLADGSRLGSSVSPCRDVVFVATDAASGLVFASLHDSIVALRWDEDVRALVEADLPLPRPSLAMARNEVLPRRAEYRPLAVVAGTPAHLVVGTYYKPDLVIVALPACAVVQRHRLEGLRIVGLAADPSGSALAVCDVTSKSVVVLPWPLPGMGPLTLPDPDPEGPHEDEED